jgi:hypothetical protein
MKWSDGCLTESMFHHDRELQSASVAAQNIALANTGVITDKPCVGAVGRWNLGRSLTSGPCTPQSPLATARSAVGIVLRFITSGATPKFCPHQPDGLRPQEAGRLNDNQVAYPAIQGDGCIVACRSCDGCTLNSEATMPAPIRSKSPSAPDNKPHGYAIAAYSNKTLRPV